MDESLREEQQAVDERLREEQQTVKVRVDGERCQGHTLCKMIAPDSFELDDIDGTSSAVSELVPPDQEDAVREAAHSCPEQAILIEETS